MLALMVEDKDLMTADHCFLCVLLINVHEGTKMMISRALCSLATIEFILAHRTTYSVKRMVVRDNGREADLLEDLVPNASKFLVVDLEEAGLLVVRAHPMVVAQGLSGKFRVVMF